MQMISGQLGRIFKGTAIYGIGQVLNRFIGFLLLPVFTSYLSPQEYGVSAILILLSGLLTCVFSLGVGVSLGIYYYVDEGHQHRANIIWTSTLILALGGLSLSVIGLLNSGLVSSVALGSTEYSYLVVLVLLTTGLGIVAQPSVLYLQFEERATLFVILSVVLTVISFGSSVFFVVFLKRGVKGLIEAGLLSQLLSFLVYFSVMVRSLKLSYDLLLAKQLVKVGMPYVLGSVGFFLIQYVDRYMLELYWGLKIVGIYSVGYNIGMIAMLIVGAFSTAWTPYFNSFFNKQEEARHVFGHVLTYYIMGMGLLGLCMFLFARPVATLMTAGPFHQAYRIVGLVALSQIIYGCYLIFLPGLYYARKTGRVNLIIFLACLLNILLNVALIPYWNMMGAVAATIISLLVMAVMTHFAAKRYLACHYDWVKISRYVAVWTISVLASYLVQEAPVITQVLKTVFILGSFLCINYFTLNKEERMYITRMCCDFLAFRRAT